MNFLVVVHESMYDLPRGAQLFFRASCMPRSCLGCVAFVRGVRGMLPRNFFLNGAIWCVLEHISINFLLKKKIKILFFLYKKIMINCSHVLARGYRSMIH